jgi:NusA-like KH domain protein
MRYINLLSKLTKIHTRNCFVYNDFVVFAVPAKLLSKAIGPAGKNVKALQDNLGKRVKIIADVKDVANAEKFVKAIVYPVEFVSLELKDNTLVLTAGSRNKAALIGRNRRRMIELNKILEDNFGKELKIV